MEELQKFLTMFGKTLKCFGFSLLQRTGLQKFKENVHCLLIPSSMNVSKPLY